jgi:hypothetical protein
VIQEASVNPRPFFLPPADCFIDSRQRDVDAVAVSTKDPATGHTLAVKPRSRAGVSDNEPAKLVCAGLALAVITLALRIMSIW